MALASYQPDDLTVGMVAPPNHLTGSKKLSPEEGYDYEATEDTFACGFYDRLAWNAKCEIARDYLWLRLLLLDPEDSGGLEAEYLVLFDGEERGGTTRDGWVQEWIPPEAIECLIFWGIKGDEPWEENEWPNVLPIDLQWFTKGA